MDPLDEDPSPFHAFLQQDAIILRVWNIVVRSTHGPWSMSETPVKPIAL